MTARQRGPPSGVSRPNNGQYNYARQGGGDDRDRLHSDSYTDRAFINPRGGVVRDGHLDGTDASMSNQNSYRPRTDSNVSLPNVESGRVTRSQVPSNPEESRGRGSSMSSSPNRMYRDDNRPRSGPSNSTSSRDRLYYTPNDFQPPQFPQNPYATKSRHSIAAESNQDGGAKRSQPNSRTQSPIPPYSSTPPPQHRYESLSPDQPRSRGNFTRQIQTEQDQNPYQLAPLNFSAPLEKESYKLLAGTRFDLANSPDTQHVKISPPEPIRPPPPPPARHNKSSHTNADHPRSSIYLPGTLSSNEADTPVRNPSNRDSTDEEWPLEAVIEFLRLNGFGEPWQQAFCAANIHGEKFRACTSLPEARKLINMSQEAHQPLHGKTLFKLITLIRKRLNPDSDTPDSETTPTPRLGDRPPDHERQPLRSQTAPAGGARPLQSNINLPSPDSPDLPSLPNSARLASRYNSEQTSPSVVRIDHPPPKLQPPPPPRKSSLQDGKRPMSPNAGDSRQQIHTPQSQFLNQYNRHSKNISTDSNQSEQSPRPSQPARSSQDFQDILQRVGKDGTIVPQKRVDKKKSHEQMSKPGIFSRFFLKSKEVVADLDQQEHEQGPMTPPLPPQPPYNRATMNNSQSSLECSSTLSTPIDERSSLTTSISSIPSARLTEPITPQYILPSVLWVQITQNGEDFRRCDLSHVGPDASLIRERVCQKFKLKSTETALYVTDIDGTPEDAQELDDDALLSACTSGDGRGSLKFLLKPQSRRPATSSAKVMIPPASQSLRPPQGGLLNVPDAHQDGRDVQSTEDPYRKGYHNTTPREMHGSDYFQSSEKEETAAKRGPSDHSGSLTEEMDNSDTARRVSNVPTRKDEVNARVFEAAAKAKEKREGRKRTESGGSEKSTPLDETPFQYIGDSNLVNSPGGRRRPSAQDDPGFEKLWGGKVVSDTTRQASLPMSPGSPGSFRLITREDNVLDFPNQRRSPYEPHSSAFESLSVKQPASQLPVRTPSGIKAQRRAPAPPQVATAPSRTSTVAATKKGKEKPLPRVSKYRRSSDSHTVTRRDNDGFIPRGPSEFAAQDAKSTQNAHRQYTPSVVADLVGKSSFTGGFIPLVAPTIVTPSKSSNLEPMAVIPKRAPSPGTPASRLGITVNTNLRKSTLHDSPPTEWQSSISPYSAMKPSPAVKPPEQKPGPSPGSTDSDRFQESANISFDDAPAFDLPDDDDEGSLWAVKPIGVEESPSNSRKNSEEKSPPLLRKKSSLRKTGKMGNRPPLTVQINDKVTEIPTPLFSAIAEETFISGNSSRNSSRNSSGDSSVNSSVNSAMTSSVPSEASSNSSNGNDDRADSPEFYIGDDKIGLSSPRHPPRSPKTLTSANSTSSANTGATDLTRKNSFAKHEHVWAVRPPPDVVLDNLEEFFPNHDLDKPILVDQGNSSPPVSPMDNSDSETNATVKPQPPLKRQLQQQVSSVPATFAKPAARMKSIRVVAKEAIEKRSRLATIAKGVKNANLLRRKSTKVWGAKMLEMTPGQVRLGQIVTVDAENDGLERRRTFKWVKGELIGKGTYGSVYLGLNATTGEMLAVKQVQVTRSISDRDDDRCKSMMDALNAEIETLKDLDHPHIVQYLGYERTEQTISIFLEYVPGGSVGRCLKKHGRFEESVIRSLIRQTLEGLAYLHAQGRLHRDLKADNLLLDLDGVCKISDFGISKQSKDVYANDHFTLAGTIFWMAPEVIQSRKEGYSAKIDIWSLGCVVLEMFAGKRPWSSDEAIGAMFKLGNERKAPPIPDDVMEYMSADAKDFLAKCFTIEAADRPTASTLLNHPFCAYDPNFNFSESKLGKAVQFEK